MNHPFWETIQILRKFGHLGLSDIISVHSDAAKSDLSGVFLAVEFTVNSQPQLSERYWYDSDLTVDYLSLLFFCN